LIEGYHSVFSLHKQNHGGIGPQHSSFPLHVEQGQRVASKDSVTVCDLIMLFRCCIHAKHDDDILQLAQFRIGVGMSRL
jgi:hypothetical protein